MPTVHVEEIVEAPRDALFAVLTDHEGYGRFPGVQGCTLIREGSSDRNGLGAVRRVQLGGPAVLDEEIVVFEPALVYEYRVIRAKPFPVKHTLGRVELESVGENRTMVVWTSIFEIAVPVVGKRLGNHAASQFARAFRRTIHSAAELALSQA